MKNVGTSIQEEETEAAVEEEEEDTTKAPLDSNSPREEVEEVNLPV